MPIKLLSSGGGSVILAAPSTGSNVTLTAPAVTANLITSGDTSTVNANMLASNSVTTAKIADSNVTASKMGYAGVPLQILQWNYSTVYENTTQNSEYDLPSPLGDGTANITLSSSSNKILFRAGMQCGQEDTWRQNYFRVYYSIGGGSWTALTGFAGLVYITSCNGGLGTFSYEYLWAPSTTTNIRFKIAQTGHANGGYLHLNQNNISNDSTARNTVQGCSYIILQEIKA